MRLEVVPHTGTALEENRHCAIPELVRNDAEAI